MAVAMAGVGADVFSVLHPKRLSPAFNEQLFNTFLCTQKNNRTSR
jgi:hypothetical protein